MKYYRIKAHRLYNGNYRISVFQHPVILFKIIFTAFTALALILQFDRFEKVKTKSEKTQIFAIIFILGWMSKVMINGPRFYQKMGWEIPATT